MEDISSKISELLSSPQGMQQLQSMASAMLGGGGSGGQESGEHAGSSGGGMADAAKLLGSMMSQSQPQGGGGLLPPGLDPKALFAIQKAFSGMNEHDKNTDLLLALRAHLSNERAVKVDESIRIMQLIKLLPLIQESGLMGGDVK